jgi:hypothetical protein
MMTTLAAAALALAVSQPNADPNAAPPAMEDAPPMTVNVYPSRSISPHLVTETLHEAGAVWNDAGITLSWRVVPGGKAEYSATPHVVINDDPGRKSSGGQLPIGWVQFHRPDEPDQEVHVSRANGLKLLKTAVGLGRSMESMPPTEINVLLGRMLGRALAHELGHFLLRSRVHTNRGLMRTGRAIREFLAVGRRGFEVDAAQRSAAAARIRQMSGGAI